MKLPAGKWLAVIPPLLMLFFSGNLFASDDSGHMISLSAGCTLDIAPFGLEQVYYTVQAEYMTPGPVSVGIKPLFAFNENSCLFRIPVIGNLRILTSDDDFFALSGYIGCGPEFYRSEEHNTVSPLLTGGLTAELGRFYIDLPVASAFRSYNTDSDVSATAGVVWRL